MAPGGPVRTSRRPDRVFLDANVLFSVAWRPRGRVARLRDRSALVLLTSEYAAEEARRNLDTEERRAALAAFLGGVLLVPTPAAPPPDAADSGLPEDDVPILAAAIASRATHLLTGDLRHFGPLLGRRIGGVRILMPGEYLGP